MTGEPNVPARPQRPRRLRRAVRRGLVWLCAGLLFLCVLLFGEQFRQSGPVLATFGIVLLLEFQNILLGRFALATGRTRFFITVMAVATVLTSSAYAAGGDGSRQRMNSSPSTPVIARNRNVRGR